jgi:dolichyl-phosphate-mannose-protein mannosyltransferase
MLPELWVLTVLSAVLRFWRLYSPQVVVFDELHYERFAGYYLTGTHFFDVHPPFARLLFAATAKLFGVAPETLIAPYPAQALRIIPAIVGTLLVPLVFIVLRQLGTSRRAATIGAAAILFDNALLSMSRLILPDIILIFFGMAAISVYLAARESTGGRRIALLATSALLAGCALSVKWTGASALGVILAAWFVESVRTAGIRRIIGEGALLCVIPVVVYVMMWAIHFSLFTHSGPGDGFMSARFLAQLPGTQQYNPAAPKVGLLETLRETHRAIRYGNGQLQNITHPASSKWYTWPTMKHPIGMWEDARRIEGTRHLMIMLGNPVVWWGGLVAFFAGIIAYVTSRRRKFAGREYGFLLLLGAVLLNYVPFMFIARVMYLYHYLFALVLLIALSAYVFDVLFGWTDEAPWQFPSRRTAIACTTGFLLMIVSFAYFLPLSYGWLLTTAAYDQRFWVLHPRF